MHRYAFVTITVHNSCSHQQLQLFSRQPCPQSCCSRVHRLGCCPPLSPLIFTIIRCENHNTFISSAISTCWCWSRFFWQQNFQMTTSTPMVSRRTAAQMRAMKIPFLSLTMSLTPLEELRSKLAFVELDISVESENKIVSSSVTFVSFKEGTFFEAGSHSLFFLIINRIQNTRFERSRKITMENCWRSISLDFYPINKPASNHPSFFQPNIPFVCVGIHGNLHIKGIEFHFLKKFSSPFDWLHSFPRFLDRWKCQCFHFGSHWSRSYPISQSHSTHLKIVQSLGTSVSLTCPITNVCCNISVGSIFSSFDDNFRHWKDKPFGFYMMGKSTNVRKSVKGSTDRKFNQNLHHIA